MISKLLLTLLIEGGVLDRNAAAEGILETRRQLAESDLEPGVRERMLRELDKMLSAIEPFPLRRKVN
jgi:hypothetical protein